MTSGRFLIGSMAAGVVIAAAGTAVGAEQWSAEKARDWYSAQPWLIGANYVPATAINQLEMWQEETFDPATIEKELGWAKSLGFNTMRVFLHDLLWHQDAEGFRRRLDQFLAICAKNGIRPMLVLFDSVWDPNPILGQQRPPKPGVHNSGWVQSPGGRALSDAAEWPRLRDYTKGVIAAFRDDARILAWDLVNEPDNTNGNSYGDRGTKAEPPKKAELGIKLVMEAFGWAREANPTQPVTSAPWGGDWSPEKLGSMNRFLFEKSDIVTFHNYGPPADFEARVKALARYQRPIICTEYMARPTGSTFEAILPIAKKYKVGAINWGFVAGKSNTIYPWETWQKPLDREPPVWFHDIFRTEGEPYRPAEVSFIREMTGAR